MATIKIQKLNIGTEFRAAIKDQAGAKVPITSDDDLTFIFRKPSGAVVTKTAIIYSEPSGVMSYTTIANDLDEAGMWRVQGRIIKDDDGDDLRTSVQKFRVYDNL